MTNDDAAIGVCLVALLLTLVVVAGIVRFVWRLLRRINRRGAAPSRGNLDVTLLDLGESSWVSLRSLLNGGLAIFGGPGSGKTSSSGKQLLRALVRNRNTGGVIHGAKPMDRAQVTAIFAEEGRLSDLMILAPGTLLRMNLLNYEEKSGQDTRSLMQFMMTVGESLQNGNSGSGEQDGKFWRMEAERMLYCAIGLLRLSGRPVTAPDIQLVINTAPESAGEIHTDEWRKAVCNQCMLAAYHRPKSELEKHEYDLIAQYWAGEYPKLAANTRSSIKVHVTGLLHVWCSGIAREMISSTTNVSPDDMFNRKWVFVDMPPSLWGASGKLINSGIKLATERAILRRKVDDSSAIVVVWVDEAPQFINSNDAHFALQAREYRGALVLIGQSISAYHAAFPGQKGEHEAEALLGAITTLIVHACDYQTAEWASRKIGQQREVMFGGGSQPADSLFDEVLGHSRISGSFSEQYQPIVRAEQFMNGLRCGGKLNGYECDAIVLRRGDPFANGRNWLVTSFSQR